MSQAVQLEVGSSANSYAILAKLATGGMAELFLARNASAAGIERYVVLKRVLAQRANDEAFVRMFLDEARLVAQLQHPNIAQVYDTGVLGDSYFFTMEYVHGETVREMLHRSYATQRAIPISSVMTVIAAAAAGLHHAHERKGLDGKPLGIVHRDVSPSNLMISFEGNVKVVDFGVAKATHRRTETQSGTVKGKIAYLSPEQCRGKVIDRRSDLFSLGIVMWEMLVGDRLFKQGTDYEIMEAIVMSTPPPPSSRREGIPPELDQIVAKLLARDPDKRYQNAGELLEAVENAAVRIGVSLSASALGRFVREMFGERPEPWIEMQERAAPPEIVTVTAAPIVGSPDTGELDAQLDSQLAKIPGLPSRSITRTPTPWPIRAAEEEEPKTTSSPSYTPYPSTGSYSSVESSPSLPAHRRKRALVFGIVGAALATGFGIVLFTRGGGGSEQSAAPTPSSERAQPAAAEAPKPDPVATKIEAPPPRPPAEPVKATKPAPAKRELANPEPKAETASPEPSQPEPAKLEAPQPKPEPAKVEPPKPKPEPVRAEPPKPKPEPPKPKPKPTPDCDSDPMSCRR